MSKKTIELVDSRWEYYTIEEYNGKYDVVKWENGTWSDTNKGSIGETSNLADALTLIRAYTGKEIKSIS